MSTATQTPSAARRQAPLRDRYLDDPAAAISTKRVVSVPTDDTDSWHGRITAPRFPAVTWDYGIDSKVGGDDDLPNPGHLLCAALAACLESTTRIVAEHYGIVLDDLTVEVTGDVDVRGALLVDRDVRTGFRQIDARIRVRPAPGTDERLVRQMLAQAEALCITLDTIRHGTQVDVATEVDDADN